MLACFAFTGYVVSIVATVPAAWRIGVWFIGAAIFHDLVLWPLYGAVDRLARRASRVDRAPATGPGAGVPWVNHVRVPTVISGVLLIISFPLVLHMADAYQRAVGLAPSPYTARWLIITAVLFGGSALLYAARWVLWRRRTRRPQSPRRSAVRA